MGRIIDIFKKKIEVYSSIEDMPAFNWFKINETNDLKYVALDLEVDSVKNSKILLEAWQKIYDEFIDTFGIPEQMMEVLRLRTAIFLLQCRMHKTKDRTLQLFIDIEQEKLSKLMSPEKATNVGQVKVYVEKFLGRHVDMKIISVKEFYEYVEAIKQQAKVSKNGG